LQQLAGAQFMVIHRESLQDVQGPLNRTNPIAVGGFLQVQVFSFLAVEDG
jgi:hypothetical protein